LYFKQSFLGPESDRYDASSVDQKALDEVLRRHLTNVFSCLPGVYVCFYPLRALAEIFVRLRGLLNDWDLTLAEGKH
jgi:hypothetical protein